MYSFLENLSTLLQDYNVLIHFNLRNIMLSITKGTNQTEVQTKKVSSYLENISFSKTDIKNTTQIYCISNYI